MTFHLVTLGTIYRVKTKHWFPRLWNDHHCVTLGHTVYVANNVITAHQLAHEVGHVRSTSWLRYVGSRIIGSAYYKTEEAKAEAFAVANETAFTGAAATIANIAGT